MKDKSINKSYTLVDSMSVDERIMAVQVLLFDIRCGGKEDLRHKIMRVKGLCIDLLRVTGDYNYHTLRKKVLRWDGEDGEYFRDYFPNGYMDMDIGLEPTLHDKSEPFKELVRDYIQYPYYYFKDIEEGEL